ncbi:MAG: HAMP domain-containing histidine kinase [Acidobacteria bacterium]|nr:HAMP domain-containing histidine kinase [Acidobacteriota bacterium]
MSLRLRLAFSFGLLVLVLVCGQWLLTRWMLRSLNQETHMYALELSNEMLTRLDPADPAAGQVVERHVEAGAWVSQQEEEVTAHIKRVEQIGPNQTAKLEFKIKGDPKMIEALDSAKIKLENDGKQGDHLVFYSPKGPIHIPLPANRMDQVVQQASFRFWIAGACVLFVGWLVTALIAHRISAPLGRLSQAAQQVGSGTLGLQVDPKGASGEVGLAMFAFNQMSAQLKQLDADEKKKKNQQHLSELGEIGRGMAHAIRNPLNAVGLVVEELAAQQPDRERAASLKSSARKNIQRIDQWIRSFLSLSREGLAEPGRIDLRALVEDVALAVMQDPERKVKVDLECALEKAPLAGWEAELKSVLHVLISNAIEASPPGGTLRIRLFPENEGYCVEVADEGPGLSAEIQKNLFQPHQTNKTYGSGMGLFLANRILINRYNGTLSLANREVGAIARAWIPMEGAMG